MFLRVSAVVLALAAVTAAAQTPPSAPAPAPPGASTPAVPAPSGQKRFALPRGPVKITAERADLEHRETALYRGNVRLVSAELTLTGDRLELQQPGRGQIRATLSGKPARLRHAGVDGASEIAASANQIVYDTQGAVIELTGGARLDRGADVLTSQHIRYDLARRRISASGTGAGQVELVIQPPPNDAAKPQNRRPNPGEPQQR